MPQRPPNDGATRPVTAGASRDRNNAAVTNDPTSRWDLKTPVGRRCRDLYKAYVRQLGNPTDTSRKALILAAAEKVTLAEIARDLCFASPNAVTFNDVVRIESKATAALKLLKLEKAIPTEPKKTYAERLAERNAVEKRS